MRELGMLLFCVYGAIYIGKALMQRRKGIKTNQMARRKVKDKTYYTELLLLISTYIVLPVIFLSIFNCGDGMPAALRWVGAALAAAGDAVFFAAVYVMRDSWRAGLAEDDKREIVTTGIYRYSRNPAFLGFDLFYIGITLMFFNWVLLAAALFAMAMLHLQILQEEQFLPTAFGQAYVDYKAQVRRYLGRKSR